MGDGERLRLRDVRAAFRLVGEVRALGAEANRWRPHMVQRLRKLLEAQIVISSEIHFREGEAGVMKVLDIGWGANRDGEAWEIHTERENEKPENYWLSVSQAAEGGGVVPVQPTKRVYGGKCFILSQYALPHMGAVDQLGLHRAWGEEPFTASDHKLVRLFHVELGRLWKKDVLRQAKDPAMDLPPRLAQTLAELVAGKSEKEIAGKLGLSRHTIHNYVKALHQRFGVSSRGELLAAAGAARGDFRPRLSFEQH